MKYLRDPAWGFIGVVVAILSLILAFVVAFTPKNMLISLNYQKNSINTPLQTEYANATKVGITQTATTESNPNNPYPSYLSGNGTLKFVDSLRQESESKWGSSSSNAGGVCQFSDEAYHVSQPPKNPLRFKVVAQLRMLNILLFCLECTLPDYSKHPQLSHYQIAIIVST